MDIENKLLVIMVLVGLILLMIIFTPKNSAEKGPDNGVKPAPPINYGNGVYYFKCIGQHFGIALGQFIAENTHKRVVAITSNNTGGYGRTEGYFVLTENK